MSGSSTLSHDEILARAYRRAEIVAMQFNGDPEFEELNECIHSIASGCVNPSSIGKCEFTESLDFLGGYNTLALDFINEYDSGQDTAVSKVISAIGDLVSSREEIVAAYHKFRESGRSFKLPIQASSDEDPKGLLEFRSSVEEQSRASVSRDEIGVERNVPIS